MEKITVDQKLQLVQMIREENQDNRMKMRSRERLLYGTDNKSEPKELRDLPLYAKGSYDIRREKELYALEEEKIPAGGIGGFSSFKLRMVLAAVLFASFLLLDSGGKAIAGITMEELRTEINKDFDAGLDEVVFDFENNFPYTLFMK